MSVDTIHKVAVIGAGVMGAGIAAQAANAGASVLLLDRVPKDASQSERSRIAEDAINKMREASAKGPLMHSSLADNLQAGNIEDHLHKLKDCDWIIEVIIENLEIKRALYQKIAAVRHPNAIVSSNTSTIPLQKLTEGFPLDFCQHFVITHFFNPPRVMRLVEIVCSNLTLPIVKAKITYFNQVYLGKTVIDCADTPGFIGNRLGVYWMLLAMHEALASGLSVEEADHIMSICGFPKTGVFGLWDLVGLDIMPDVVKSLADFLPSDDPFLKVSSIPTVVHELIKMGRYGRKGKNLKGFYQQRVTEDNKKIRDVVNLQTLEYSPANQIPLSTANLKPGQIIELISRTDPAGIYARNVIAKIISYAALLLNEVTDKPQAIDQAMQLGYSWSFGPFQLLDLLHSYPATHLFEQVNITPPDFLSLLGNRYVYTVINHKAHVLDNQGDYHLVQGLNDAITLAQIKSNLPLYTFSKSKVFTVEQGIWLVEFTDKVPSVSSILLHELFRIVNLAEQQKQAIIFYNEQKIFCAGADLKEFYSLLGNTSSLDEFLTLGQKVFKRLQQAAIPVIAAPIGKALGGGLELILHCHRVQAYCEVSVGLVETRLGIIPGWGGCKEILRRNFLRLGNDETVPSTFELINNAVEALSAHEAKALGIFTTLDSITMNKERVLHDAVLLARKLIAEPASNELLFPALKPLLPEKQKIGESHQGLVSSELLKTLNYSAEDEWEDAVYSAEKQSVMKLCNEDKAKQRFTSFLVSGQFIRN